MTISHPASTCCPPELWTLRQQLVDTLQWGWWKLADFDKSLVDCYGSEVIKPAAEQEGHTKQHVYMRVSLARAYPDAARVPNFGLARAALQRAKRLGEDHITILEEAVQGGSQVKDLAS